MIKKQFGELESKIFLKFQNPLFFEKVIQLWSAQKVLRLKNSRKEKFFNHPNAPKNERVPYVQQARENLTQAWKNNGPRVGSFEDFELLLHSVMSYNGARIKMVKICANAFTK